MHTDQNGLNPKAAFPSTLLDENILRLKIIGLVGLLINTVLIIIAQGKSDSPGFTNNDTLIRLVWIALTLVFFLLPGKSLQKGTLFRRVVFLTAALLSPLFASMLTLNLLGSNVMTFVYIVNILIIGAFLFLSVFEFVIAQLPGYLFLLVGLVEANPERGIFIPIVVNVTGIILFSGFMSFLNYRIKSRQYYAEVELRQANIELKALANLDGLTGLPNRRKIAETLAFWRSFLERKPLSFAFIMLDVDFFKPYNDTYGHLAGDDCLKMIAAAIQGVLKRDSDFVGRFGGEEFLVILPDIDRKGAEGIAERIRSAVFEASVIHVAVDLGLLSISAGVAVSPHCFGSKLDSLLEAADRALYRAKEAGRNCVIVEDRFEG